MPTIWNHWRNPLKTSPKSGELAVLAVRIPNAMCTHGHLESAQKVHKAACDPKRRHADVNMIQKDNKLEREKLMKQVCKNIMNSTEYWSGHVSAFVFI